ncbi:MAG: GntR family transcriptional regulator [Gammaproteobacteria bacterium]|nr:GntR family transcriptional regulator [Gammaproteobacteria bacterium]
MLVLNPSSGVPIYRQIVDKTRRLVATGELAPGDKLPSVRAIATELGINPMTVSKAYSMLDQAGIVVRRAGIGMVVAKAGADRALAMEPETRALVANAKQLGVSRADLIAQIDRIWEET